MGIQITPYLSERLFDMMDIDHDGKLSFTEFMFCFDKLINPDDQIKARLYFYLAS